MSGQEKNIISLCPFHALFNRYILQVVRLSGEKNTTKPNNLNCPIKYPHRIPITSELTRYVTPIHDGYIYIRYIILMKSQLHWLIHL